MKKLMYGGLFLVLVGVGIFACRKENLNPATTSLQTKDVSSIMQKNDLSSPSEKSTGNGGLDSMAQAANFAQIKYNSSHHFSVDSYDDSLIYQVTVNEFYPDSVIKLHINDGTINHNVYIDVKNKEIHIGLIGNFTFDNYYGSSGLTAHSGTIKNIVAVFTPYYAIFGNVTNTWKDNGSGDTFHPAGIFWGQVERSRTPCDPILHIQTVVYDDYAFWIRVKKNRVEYEPC